MSLNNVLTDLLMQIKRSVISPAKNLSVFRKKNSTTPYPKTKVQTSQAIFYIYWQEHDTKTDYAPRMAQHFQMALFQSVTGMPAIPHDGINLLLLKRIRNPYPGGAISSVFENFPAGTDGFADGYVNSMYRQLHGRKSFTDKSLREESKI